MKVQQEKPKVMKFKDYMKLGKDYYYNHNDAQRALECFESALAFEPTNVEAYFNKANALRTLHLYDDAETIVDIGFSLNNKMSDYFFIKSRILSDRENVIEAVKHYESGVKAGGKRYEESYYNQAKAAQGIGRWQEAIKLFDKALDCTLTFSVAVKSKIGLYYDLRMYTKVIEACDHGIKYCPNKFVLEFMVKKIDAYYGLGKNEDALECCDKAILLYPHSTAPFYQKALILVDKGHLEAAINLFDNILAKVPDSELYLGQKKVALTMLMEKNPYVPNVYHKNALFYLETGKPETAVKIYLDAMAVFMSDNIKAAKDFGQKILNVQRDKEMNLDIRTLYDLAEGMKLIGEDWQSTKAFKNIVYKDNTHVQAHIGLVNSLIAQNKYHEAIIYLRANKYIIGELYDLIVYEFGDDNEGLVKDIIMPYIEVNDIDFFLGTHLVGEMPHPLEIVEN